MSTRTEANNIWLQPGTRLHMLVYREGVWQVWIATNSRSGDSDEWLGTYMDLHPNGMCVQHLRSETEISEIVIRPATGDAI